VIGVIVGVVLAALLSVAQAHAQPGPPGGSGGGLNALGSATAVSAAGTTQGTATRLTANINIITSISAGQGVILNGSAALQTVINPGAVTALVYPNSGATITGGGTTLATNAPFSIAAGSSANFSCVSSTACYASFTP
jgi:hypothetical protein